MNPNVVVEIVDRQTERNMPPDEQVVSDRTRDAINRIREQRNKSEVARRRGHALVAEQVILGHAPTYQEHLSRLEDEVAVRDAVALELGAQGYDVIEIFSENIIDTSDQYTGAYVGLKVQL